MRRVRLAFSTGGLVSVGVNSKWKDFVFSMFSSAGGEGRKQSGVSSKEYLTILARLFFVLKCLMHAPSKNASFDCAQMFSSSSFRKYFLLILPQMLISGSFRECFQASIVLGHPAAPVLPKSRSGMW